MDGESTYSQILATGRLMIWVSSGDMEDRVYRALPQHVHLGSGDPDGAFGP
jgi:hypothetical protein